MVSNEDEQRDLAALVVLAAGALVATADRWEPYRLVDRGGVPVAGVASFFLELQAAGRSQATVRSYGMDLLRWFLWAIDVGWDQASRVEARFLPLVADRGQAGPTRPSA